MANPTLVGSETPYSGFTVAQIVERLLATRGLTEDATTGRTVATSDDSAQARVFVRRAVNALNGTFPSVWSIREATGTWIAGDSMIALPQNARAALYVLFDGVPLRAINRDDDLRNRTQNVSNGVAGQLKTGAGVEFYRTVGFTSLSGTDKRPVIQLFATPPEAKSYIIGYNAKAPALTTDADAMPMMDSFQEWVLIKARELWATEVNDTVTKQVAMADLARQEQAMIPELESMLEAPKRMRWRYPNRAGFLQRGR